MKCLKRLFSKKKKPIYKPNIAIDNWSIDELELLIAINIYRYQEKKLDPLQAESFLHSLAEQRTLTVKYGSHVGVGEYFKYMTEINFTKVNECLAFKYTRYLSVFNALKKSASHNKILLSDNKYCGISYRNNVWVIFICSI